MATLALGAFQTDLYPQSRRAVDGGRIGVQINRQRGVPWRIEGLDDLPDRSFKPQVLPECPTVPGPQARLQ